MTPRYLLQVFAVMSSDSACPNRRYLAETTTSACIITNTASATVNEFMKENRGEVYWCRQSRLPRNYHGHSSRQPLRTVPMVSLQANGDTLSVQHHDWLEPARTSSKLLSCYQEKISGMQNAVYREYLPVYDPSDPRCNNTIL